jgi:hypothetical protein
VHPPHRVTLILGRRTVDGDCSSAQHLRCHGRTVDFTNTLLIMTSNLRQNPKDIGVAEDRLKFR